ncbi:MAG: hypothetical protein IT263_07730, partial [Saprospiraceae bacterium]|nr:hypothetical protein [Saprospiraceae bacterium]
IPNKNSIVFNERPYDTAEKLQALSFNIGTMREEKLGEGLVLSFDSAGGLVTFDENAETYGVDKFIKYGREGDASASVSNTSVLVLHSINQFQNYVKENSSMPISI